MGRKTKHARPGRPEEGSYHIMVMDPGESRYWAGMRPEGPEGIYAFAYDASDAPHWCRSIAKRITYGLNRRGGLRFHIEPTADSY